MKPPKPTTALISIAWGRDYARFVPDWWDTINNLDPAPDEIVIAHHPDDPTGVTDLPVTLVECRERSLPKMLNAAIAATSADWIQQCPLDDRLTPDALAVIQTAKPGTELLVVGAQSATRGDIWLGDWSTIWASPRDYRMNHHVPIARTLWERIGGYSDHHWCDWAFFLRADKAGAVVEHRDVVTLLFGDEHSGRMSNLGGAAADAQIAALKAELCA